MRALALILLAAAAAHADDLRTELAALSCVDGAAVSDDGRPGRFYLLSKRILAQGDAALFARLAADERPVTRAMGLYCLARTEGAKAAATLRQHLGDRGRIEYMPGGCLVWTTTVGAFARELLLNADCIAWREGGPRPLVPEKEHLALELDVLARDECTDLHENAARAVRDAEPPLDRRKLAALCPGLEAWQVVKALGRTTPRPELRAFLQRCLKDADLDAAARRAAASALTRDPSDASLAALRGFGEARFVADAEARRAHDARMAPVRAETTWRGMERIRKKVVLAFTAEHPLALPELEGRRSLAILGHQDVRAALVGSFVRIAGRAPDFAEPWDTYGDVRFRLERIADGRLEPDERAQVRAALR